MHFPAKYSDGFYSPVTLMDLGFSILVVPFVSIFP